MKKLVGILLILLLVLLGSVLLLKDASVATDTYAPFSCTIISEKQDYEKGEAINISASINNISLDNINHMRIWVDYSVNDGSFVPGPTESFVKSFSEAVQVSLRVAQDEGIQKIYSKLNENTFVGSLLEKLSRNSNRIKFALSGIRYGVQNGFVPLLQNTADLGTVKVLYNNTEVELTVKCRYSVKEAVYYKAAQKSEASGVACVKIQAVENSFTGLTFAMEKDGSDYGLFAVNPDYAKVSLFHVQNGEYHLLGSKDVTVKAGTFYSMQVLFDGNRVLCYFLNNPTDSAPYPVFDVYYTSEDKGYGVFCTENGYEEFTVTPGEIPTYDKTYQNPVCENAADPYILKDGDTYYLYATTGSTVGFHVYSSIDLVNWQDRGLCAQKGIIYGSEKFWAPEVYRYRDTYYLLYSTDEHPALAVSDSPLGPFTKTKDGYLLEEHCIDGHLFFDDDGSVYMYMAYWAQTGEEIWGCQLKTDLSGMVPGTLTQLTACKEDEGGVNEGPAVLKYKGKYYLTYSVNGYEKPNYSVRLAVADSPLGAYSAKGTILQKSSDIIGTGHHSFVTSPDGEELMIAYHCHYSATQIHPRMLCIDRCKFVETENGYTISVYAPTSTPQPYPGE